MDPIWMKNWPSFVPSEVQYPNGRKPVFEYLRDNAREFPERTAVVYYGREIIYGELDRKSEQVARCLIDLGFQKGDRIALFLPTCPQYHIAHYGICKMGGIIVPCSPLFKQWELAYQLKETGAGAIICLDQLYPVVAEAAGEADLQTVVVTSLHDFLPAQPTMNLTPMMAVPKQSFPGTTDFMEIFERYPSEPVAVYVGLEETAQLQFTGGTTGLPKGAVLTHGGKLFKVAAALAIKAANKRYVGIEGTHITNLTAMPTFHIAGMLGSVDTITHTFDTFMPMDRPKYASGCQGIPIPEQQIKIVSWEERDREMSVGEMGEIAIKNPAVFKGYWNRPEETAATLVDGWVYTGDMGRFDEDGYLFFLGRKKEMIKVSGFSVFPEEVETLLCRHEAVEQAAAIGVPDPKRGEVVKAFVVLKPEFKGKISPPEIIDWAKPNMSSYKVPQAVVFRDALPMSGVGKVLRRVLVEEEQKR